jgi:hypothetical protein
MPWAFLLFVVIFVVGLRLWGWRRHGDGYVARQPLDRRDRLREIDVRLRDHAQRVAVRPHHSLHRFQRVSQVTHLRARRVRTQQHGRLSVRVTKLAHARRQIPRGYVPELLTELIERVDTIDTDTAHVDELVARDVEREAEWLLVGSLDLAWAARGLAADAPRGGAVRHR